MDDANWWDLYFKGDKWGNEIWLLWAQVKGKDEWDNGDNPICKMIDTHEYGEDKPLLRAKRCSLH